MTKGKIDAQANADNLNINGSIESSVANLAMPAKIVEETVSISEERQQNCVDEL